MSENQNNNNHNHRNKRMHIAFYVTGFSSFPTVAENPTQILIGRLRQYFETTENSPPTIHTLGRGPTASAQGPDSSRASSSSSTGFQDKVSYSIQSFSVIPVSAIDCVLALHELQNKQVQLPSSMQEDSDLHVQRVFLHMGVYAGSKQFAIERMAYNEASFGVPDIRNWKPLKQAVLEKGEPHLQTDLPVEALVHALASNFIVAPSKDPGRYICNWIYYMSLHHSQVPTNSSSSLFIHVPTFEVFDKDTQTNFILRLIEAIVTSFQ